MKRHLVLAFVVLLSGSAANADVAGGSPRVDPLPRDLEIQLALSTLPRHLREQATVYVLNPDKGYEVVHAGTNGFHAFVARTGDDAFRGSWEFKAYRDDILYPISFDAAGAQANMRVFFDAAELRAKGTPPQELKKLIQERYRTSYYRAPERSGVSYMMAPILRTYIDPDHGETVATNNVPHVMHYVPNVENDAVGGDTPEPAELQYFIDHGHWQHNPDPFVIEHGPHGYMVQFLGVTERNAVNQEYAPMLARLCKIKKVWCLPQ